MPELVEAAVRSPTAPDRDEIAVAPETEHGWASLDRFAIRERSQRLMHGMTRCEVPRLADFEVVRKLGVGSNAIVYLAKCRTDGQLCAHVDTLVVLKVLVHYKQESAAGDEARLSATSSALDRVFAAEVCASRARPVLVFLGRGKSPTWIDLRSQVVCVTSAFTCNPAFDAHDL